MSTDAIIRDILRREGGAVHDPHDMGGRTNFGISEKAHPEAWADGTVTEDEARAIYFKKYVEYPGYGHIPESHRSVQEQLIDFGVNSGPGVATQKLQIALGQTPDGVFGPETLGALLKEDPRTVGNALAVARGKMLGRLVQENTSQATFLSGWLNRATEFIT